MVVACLSFGRLKKKVKTKDNTCANQRFFVLPH